MTHTDACNILQAIIAEPDDDLHRFAYADWCEENGQPERAEFIRLQIALWNEQRDCNCGSTQGGHAFKGGQHHNGPCAASQLRIEVNGKWKNAAILAAALWITNCRRWVGIGSGRSPLECLAITPNQYTRGFIRKVECTHDVWVDHGKKICTEHPIEDVRLTDKEPLELTFTDIYAAPEHLHGKPFWCWTSPNYPPKNLSDCLTFDIYKHLLEGWKPWNRQYLTEEAAYAAVAKACIAYGRSK